MDEDCEHENRYFEYYPFNDCFSKNWQDEDGSDYLYELDEYYLSQMILMMSIFPCKEVRISGQLFGRTTKTWKTVKRNQLISNVSQGSKLSKSKETNLAPC